MPVDDRFERGFRAFNNHIEGCSQCAKQIFNLCPVGDGILRPAGDAAADRLKAMGEPFMASASNESKTKGKPHAG